MAGRITGAALTRGGALAFLETLTDTIGGRLTGSSQNRAASELILATLKEAGFENAHFEEYPLESRWQRGPATGRIVSPIVREILVGSLGRVPGTASSGVSSSSGSRSSCRCLAPCTTESSWDRTRQLTALERLGVLWSDWLAVRDGIRNWLMTAA